MPLFLNIPYIIYTISFWGSESNLQRRTMHPRLSPIGDQTRDLWIMNRVFYALERFIINTEPSETSRKTL